MSRTPTKTTGGNSAPATGGAGPPVASAGPGRGDAAAELNQLDEQLARRAETAIQSSVADEGFELEGDFLSQEEISRIMEAESSARPAAGGVAESAEAGGQAEAWAGSAATAPPAELASPSPQAPGGGEATETKVAAEPGAKPVAAEVQPAAAGPPWPIAREGSSAGPPAGATLTPPPAADSSADDREAEELLASAGKAEAEVGRPAGLATWQRGLAAAAAVLDLPFSWVPPKAKTVIGLVGGVAFLGGLAVWIVALVG